MKNLTTKNNANLIDAKLENSIKKVSELSGWSVENLKNTAEQSINAALDMGLNLEQARGLFVKRFISNFKRKHNLK